MTKKQYYILLRKIDELTAKINTLSYDMAKKELIDKEERINPVSDEEEGDFFIKGSGKIKMNPSW